jgi:UvrD-like helicase C-terminal domain/AAA domain
VRFLLADSFTGALARLPTAEAKTVKTTVVDLQIDPTGKGLSFHRIDKSKDANFWSVLVGRDLRLIVHKTADSLLVAYVDHHDKAYAWAERRRIEAHPTTGAVQIVEVRERVEEIAAAPSVGPSFAAGAPSEPTARLFFAGLDDAALLSVGVPADWLGDVRAATEDTFLDVAAHLPAEAAEALLQYATAGILPISAPAPVADAYAHPDAQRRIRLIVDEEELRHALEYPWERWSVFLHPSQRAVVERRFGGPARVAGSAGTGKTVVALHRAVALAGKNPQARLLLTTFSEPLARSLAAKLTVLAPETGGIVPRITVSDWHGVADELFQLIHGRRPRIVAADMLRTMTAKASEAAGVRGFTQRFLLSELTNVVDAWGIDGPESYASVPRLGRRSPLGPRQRERLWSVFGAVAAALREQGIFTRCGVCREVAAHYGGRERKPFEHIVVDEAQDLGPAELSFLAAIAPPGEDALFFAGDIGQRIFQHPFSWKALGIDVRGRSSTLKVCYRTSRQIRSIADRLLPGALRDPDGNEEERSGTISVFDGPAPVIAVVADAAQEIERVAEFLRSSIADGIEPTEIGLFVRSPEVIGRARAALEASGLADWVKVSVMHLAKGLEFRAVAVMACDQDILPLESRIAEAADEGELDDIYETERQLLYVSCTRARDRLLVTGVAPASEFLKDL